MTTSFAHRTHCAARGAVRSRNRKPAAQHSVGAKPLSARNAILRFLQTYRQRNGRLDDLLEHSPLMQLLDHRDRRFVFEAVYGVVRRRLTLDWIIDSLLSSPKAGNNADLRDILRLGIYQLLYMDRVPDHAAVNESVEAAKKAPATRYAAPLVNALLRNVIKRRRDFWIPAEADVARRLSVEHSHPEWLIIRWLERFGLSKTRALLEFNNRRPEIFLRRSVRGLSKQQYEIESRGLCGPATGFLNLYRRLEKAVLPEDIHLLQDGKAVIQAPSSGWVVAMLDCRPEETVIDLCAAPGGKTALAAELVGENGAVIAADIHPRRLDLIKDTAHIMRLRNVQIVRMDSRRLAIAGQFGKVLLDAPCSATGVLHRHPDARWNKSIGDIAALAQLQNELLDAAAGLVAPHGALVYATCSLEPEENEHAVEKFLQTHAEFVLDRPPATIPQKLIDQRGYLRILPQEHGIDGMFAARLKRR